MLLFFIIQILILLMQHSEKTKPKHQLSKSWQINDEPSNCPKRTGSLWERFRLPNISQTAIIPTMRRERASQKHTLYMTIASTFLCRADKSEEMNWPPSSLCFHQQLMNTCQTFEPRCCFSFFLANYRDVWLDRCLHAHTPTCGNSDTHTHTAAVWSILRRLATQH